MAATRVADLVYFLYALMSLHYFLLTWHAMEAQITTNDASCCEQDLV